MKNGARSKLKALTRQNEFVLIILIVALCIILQNVNQGFFTVINFRTMSRGFAIKGFALIGMAFLLITGMFDMSIGSVMVLSGFIFTSLVSKNNMNVNLALLIALAGGVGVGLINGLMVTKLRVNAFITTLSTMTIFRGLVLSITQGNPMRCADRDFSNLSKATIYGWPVMLFVFLATIIVLDIFLRNVRWFRQLYFIGGNEYSAGLTGINVSKMRVILFVISGLLAALSGCLSASRLQACVPTSYGGDAMQLMVACVIGGCSFNGGRGTLFGSILGLLFLTLLDNGMVMMGINIYWFNTVLGLFLIAVVFINTLSASSMERRKIKEMKQEFNA